MPAERTAARLITGGNLDHHWTTDTRDCTA